MKHYLLCYSLHSLPPPRAHVIRHYNHHIRVVPEEGDREDIREEAVLVDQSSGMID